MVNTAIKIFSVVIMVIIIFVVDFLFLRNLFWERLAVNIGIVLAFLVLYMTVLND